MQTLLIFALYAKHMNPNNDSRISCLIQRCRGLLFITLLAAVLPTEKASMYDSRVSPTSIPHYIQNWSGVRA